MVTRDLCEVGAPFDADEYGEIVTLVKGHSRTLAQPIIATLAPDGRSVTI